MCKERVWWGDRLGFVHVENAGHCVVCVLSVVRVCCFFWSSGLGAVYEIELLEESAEAFIFGERGKASPKGIAGGQPALPNVFEYENDGIWKTPPMVSKMLGIRLKKGERVRLQTPGGGGWGKPGQRYRL